ncbi:MAG: hypothetical protein Q9M76_02225 [Candidatus Dojkabacteria bacterium]|nr:hypothetical protein [Candidatus Dojkabacteria bacterium]
MNRIIEKSHSEYDEDDDETYALQMITYAIEDSKIQGVKERDVFIQLLRESFSEQEIIEDILFCTMQPYDLYPIVHRAHIFSPKVVEFRRINGIDLEKELENPKGYVYHGTPRSKITNQIPDSWIDSMQEKGFIPSDDGAVHAWIGTPLRALGIADTNHVFQPTYRIKLD